MQPSVKEEDTPDDSQGMEGEIPILMPLRYDANAKGRCKDSPKSDIAPPPPSASHQSRFSFGRKARGMVDSMLPEPLKTRTVAQKRTVKMEELPANLASETYAAVCNQELHQPRPSSSVYDDDIWPDLTSSSENTWGRDGSSAGNVKSGLKEQRECYIAQPNTSTLVHGDSMNANHGLEQLQVPSQQKYPVPSPNQFRLHKKLPSLPTEHRSAQQRLHSGQRDDSVEVKAEHHATRNTLDEFRYLADTGNDMYSQLAALRVPIRRRHEACLPPITKNTDEEASTLLHSSTDTADDSHVPFDPVDPYHRSGQPKKKTLYGPDGYLGKDKDWKQSNLQKVAGKVESLGHRVKKTIQRTLEGDRDDNRMELLQGIVMKPSISINVDPEVQSEIYSKLELFLCTSANTYLLIQMHNGRFGGNDSVKKFIDEWTSKNRPLVPEFQFDLKTQREIILHNRNTFDFPGKYGIDPVLLRSTLDGWGSVIKQLNVRTYCWPDSAIRKLFHDVYPVLEMLGASREIIATFLDIKQLVVGLIHKAKYKKRMDELKRSSSGRQWS